MRTTAQPRVGLIWLSVRSLPTARPVSVEPTQVVQASHPVPTPCTRATPVVRCAAVTPAKSMSVRFARHGDGGYMEYHHGDGSIACFKGRTLEDGAAGKLCLSAGKSCLLVKGVDWKAYADQIDVREDGRVVLRGNVRMMCDKLGVCASVRAEELNVEVKNGKFEKLVTK